MRGLPNRAHLTPDSGDARPAWRRTCEAISSHFKVSARPLVAGVGASARRETRWRHGRARYAAGCPRPTAAAQTSSWRTVRDCKHGHGAGRASSYYFQRPPFPRTPSLTGFPMTSALKVVCKSVAFCAAATKRRGVGGGGACVVCMCATTTRCYPWARAREWCRWPCVRRR